MRHDYGAVGSRGHGAWTAADPTHWDPLPALPIALTPGHVARVAEELQLQTAVQSAQRAKTAFGMRQLAELYQEAVFTERETIEFVSRLDATCSGPYGQLLASAEHQLTLDFIDHIHKAHRLGAMRIAIEIDRTLYLPPEKPGLLSLLAAIARGGR